MYQSPEYRHHYVSLQVEPDKRTASGLTSHPGTLAALQEPMFQFPSLDCRGER